jgi:D-alanyl-D-alanine dipeptidase
MTKEMNLRNQFEVMSPQQDAFMLDMVYASDRNFTKQVIYQHPILLMHQEAAKRFRVAAKLANKMGFTLKVFDMYRPLEAQRKMFQLFPDDRYVSDPDKGFATHTRGVAVDLTMVDKTTKLALDMGSEFDDFTEKAHHTNFNFPPVVLRNRALLVGIMHITGFEKIDTEWWHYQLPDYDKYPKTSQQDLGVKIVDES